MECDRKRVSRSLYNGIHQVEVTVIRHSRILTAIGAVIFFAAASVGGQTPAHDASARLQQVLARLKARATDAELESLPVQALAGQSNRPTNAGRPENVGRPSGVGAAAGNHPAGGPPAGVPANAGRGAKPTTNPGRGH